VFLQGTAILASVLVKQWKIQIWRLP